MPSQKIYKMQRIVLSLIACFIFLAGVVNAAEGYDPLSVYLTWQRKPDTTMTIQWITPFNRKDDLIEYRMDGETSWQRQTGTHKGLPEQFPYFLHRIELVDLQPASSYQFRIGSDGKIFKFRTMPSQLIHPVQFVSGGDMYRDSLEAFANTNKQAANTRPLFALIGGDIAYTGRRYRFLKEDGRRWLDWLITWKRTMVTPEGFLIPLIPAIGNHETNGSFDETPSQAPFFYALFSFPGQQGYRVLDFGNYLSIFVLDTNHTHPIEGRQAAWLQMALKARKNVLHKAAIYHVPAYPSQGNFDHPASQMVRKMWVPSFEAYGLNVAYEHHAHTYKRTHLIKDGKVSGEGVLYLGDGAWSVGNLRKPYSPNEKWYLAHTQSINHFILTTLDNSQRVFQAIDSSGKVIDQFLDSSRN